jgi:hypothetical protein
MVNFRTTSLAVFENDVERDAPVLLGSRRWFAGLGTLYKPIIRSFISEMHRLW